MEILGLIGAAVVITGWLIFIMSRKRGRSTWLVIGLAFVIVGSQLATIADRKLTERRIEALESVIEQGGFKRLAYEG